MSGIVVEQVEGQPSWLHELLDDLDAVHRLHDSRFVTPDHLTGSRDPGIVRLVAAREGRSVGFLAGAPAVGHIALLGVLHEGVGVGSALLAVFLEQARAAGAAAATVVLDTDPHGRWRRRRFFEAREFVASRGSALHFHREL